MSLRDELSSDRIRILRSSLQTSYNDLANTPLTQMQRIKLGVEIAKQEVELGKLLKEKRAIYKKLAKEAKKK